MKFFPDKAFNKMIHNSIAVISRFFGMERAFLVDEATRPIPEPSGEKLPGVTAVIPAYNEELFIGSVVLKTCRMVQKVIVVDDGSKDRTTEVARYAGAEVIRLDKNHGKAHTLLLGLRRAHDLGCKAAVVIGGDGQ
jgi:cellulose synthase/poly-beta-1,6-N-acetylglucosamine synthase-like glycosyltransferase